MRKATAPRRPKRRSSLVPILPTLAVLLAAALAATAAVTYQTVDRTPPTWSNLTQDRERVGPGGTVVISAVWSDDTELDRAILNVSVEPGVWTEAGTQFLGGKRAEAVFIYTAPDLAPGTVISWKMRGQDRAGNRAETRITKFLIADLIPPTWSGARWDKELDVGQENLLEVALADDILLADATFLVNETGEFEAVRSYRLNVKETTVSLTWTNRSPLEPGSVVMWRVGFKDAWNNTNVTDNFAFRFGGCPPCPEPTGWSECQATPAGGRQSRVEFVCGPGTDYRCQSEEQVRACQLGVSRAQAEGAMASAQTEIETAKAAGKDTLAAEARLREAQDLYARGQWAEAEAAAQEAKRLAATALPPPPPPGPDWTLITAVIVVIAGVVLYAYRKGLLKGLLARFAKKEKKEGYEFYPEPSYE